MEPGDLHREVETAFNAGDVDALVALYDDDAAMATPEGEFVRGKDAIRDQWAGFIALGGRIEMTTRFAVETGDVALLSNDWHFLADGIEVGGDSRTIPGAT
jgi:uncharacterized protein (TIGR02246 family)